MPGPNRTLVRSGMCQHLAEPMPAKFGIYRPRKVKMRAEIARWTERHLGRFDIDFKRAPTVSILAFPGNDADL